MNLFLPPLLAPINPSLTLSPKVLSDWLKAISAFQNSFCQLNHYRLTTLNTDPEGPALGQRTNAQVTRLLERMCQELTTLGTELNCLSEPTSLPSHTARLQSLTNQATIILGLLYPSNG